MAEAAQEHLEEYLKRPYKYRLRALRFCHKYTISELRRAIKAYGAGDDDSAA
jgi:hypothetical protein